MTRTWAKLNNDEVVILNCTPWIVEEAAENGELIPTLDGKRSIPAEDISLYRPHRPSDCKESDE